jgi:hypothetical protein
MEYFAHNYNLKFANKYLEYLIQSYIKYDCFVGNILNYYINLLIPKSHLWHSINISKHMYTVYTYIRLLLSLKYRRELLKKVVYILEISMPNFKCGFPNNKE